MLLAIKKIDSSPVKDENGAHKIIPGTNKKLMAIKVLDEAIDVNLIKSIRPFHKGGKMYSDIEGDISVVYFKSNDKLLNDEGETEKVHEMHIVCNWETLLKDVNKLRSGKELTETASV